MLVQLSSELFEPPTRIAGVATFRGRHLQHAREFTQDHLLVRLPAVEFQAELAQSDAIQSVASTSKRRKRSAPCESIVLAGEDSVEDAVRACMELGLRLSRKGSQERDKRGELEEVRCLKR